ncbi:protein spire homolog 1 isoform X10 [Danio rerio]|uniref:Protein spire homolog 1 isoform X10 n=1 Tax=Danio rerio TaxID=7955 RepID=A0A8M3AL19_DANRE|nr:protein spire homolog 1 isoform X8 [Danio rerio]|eukprot:XP_009292599.1 protein spire homolog 1 isoform X8 [Danio rerio]
MTDGGMLISPSALQDPGDGARPEDIAMDCTDGEEELCLEEILTLYSQPINEEQAWAVCYQCCRWLTQKHRRKETGVSPPGRIAGPGDVRIRKDGNVKLYQPSNPDKHTPPSSSIEIIESLGIMIYKALDYGLKEHEERELSPPLEQLIDLMTNMADTETDCPDEGYEATEEEDEGEEENAEVSNVRGYRDIISLCLSHLPSPSDAPNHYQAVCRALYAETKELRTFLEKIKSAKENLRKMEGETEEPVRDLNELQNADWARFWVQVMRDLRHGVKLKKVQERQYNPLAIEYQLTPYEMLMDDIRSKRYKLRKVMVNGDIPPRLKKSAHEIILEFIRSRPPLNPVSARKLKPHAPQPPTLHERILEEIRSERKLRPVSPDMIRRSRLDIPDGPRKLAISTLSLANGTSPARSPVNGVAGGHSLSQRKRLLKAPTLAELDSSDSEEEQSTRKSDSSSSISTSLVEDTSPESVMGKKPPPQFLPISSTPQPDKRIAPQRRHSIEKEAPTNIRHFLPPSRQNSKSLEEFCFPVECLTLTVEEVMHIRQVLVKAELEKFQQYKDIYNALKKGKLCFSCRSKKFSLFTWSYTCQFCKRPVCSQCCKKMKLPSKPHASLPISSLGPSILPKKEPGASSAPTDKTSSTSSHKKNSLQRSLSRSSKHGDRSSSKDELELPEQFTEDWSTMEVCVDCKKFINDIISNSRRNLSTKRARLHRRTHSVYSSSTSSSNYKPTERTIKEV